eukprot:Filipodium_phascolosomae@DN1404_c0_g1_i1.p1
MRKSLRSGMDSFFLFLDIFSHTSELPSPAPCNLGGHSGVVTDPHHYEVPFFWLQASGSEVERLYKYLCNLEFIIGYNGHVVFHSGERVHIKSMLFMKPPPNSASEPNDSYTSLAHRIF